MEELPPSLRPYRRTPTFDAETLPAGLRQSHRTKPGVWGLIQVLSGRLTYHIETSGETLTLTPARPGVVEPDIPHHVVPDGPVRFYVEFYR